MESEQSLRKAILLKENICSQIKINVIEDSPSSRKRSSYCPSEDSFCDDRHENPEVDEDIPEWKLCAKHFKLFSLFILWVICSVALLFSNERIQDTHQISIPKESTKGYLILKQPKNDKVTVMLEGALLPPYYKNLSENWVAVWIQLMVFHELPQNSSKIKPSNIILIQNVSDVWYVPLVTEKLIGVVPEYDYKRTFQLSSFKIDNTSHNFFRIQFGTNSKTNVPLSLEYNLQPINPENGIIYAAIILIGLYLLIMFDIIHRTLAAMLASTMSVALLAILNARPTMAEIISWIDAETLLLLFSMMTLVTILSETGVFDYMSVMAFKLTGGKVWPLVNALCLITALISSTLDNVTTALLITPVTIKLCEVMKFNPVPVLICTIIVSNLGGAITPIGDPPNVLIANNGDVIKAGINFGVFTLHMGIGVVLATAVVYAQLRYVFRDISCFKYSEPREVQSLKREIAVYQRTTACLGSYSKDEENVKETLRKKTNKLQGILRSAMENTSANEEMYNVNINDLEKLYPIRDKVLLVKSGCTLLLVICVFFLHSIPFFNNLGLGWTALLGALLSLLLYDKDDIEGIFGRVEWSTLLFFASLFILMEALSRLGLIEWIGKQTQMIVMSVSPDARLAAAIILILWISGLASAFVDNLPLTTMMIKIATNLANERELNLPLPPLIWALSFGACLGGNGTLFGSSSNIVFAGVAEQHGYRLTFLEFMKIGFPITVSSLTVVTIYLVVCHVLLDWH